MLLQQQLEENKDLMPPRHLATFLPGAGCGARV